MLVAPRVSTAERRLITALRFAMRHIPLASATVATIGNPSGTAATDRAIAVSTMRYKSLPPIIPVTATKKAIAIVIQISLFPRRSNLFSKGVISSLASAVREEI